MTRDYRHIEAKNLLPVLLSFITARSWQHAVNNTTVQLTAQRIWIYVVQPGTSKVHPKPIFLVTHKTGTASCGTSNSIILVFVFISMYGRQVIDSFSVCSYFQNSVSDFLDFPFLQSIFQFVNFKIFSDGDTDPKLGFSSVTFSTFPTNNPCPWDPGIAKTGRHCPKLSVQSLTSKL